MSYALYIGRDHSADGCAWLAGYGDEPSSHWLEIEPRRSHPEGAAISVGMTPEAALPGVLTEIPEARETHRHIRVSYSHYLGAPPPLTNGGLNEFGVAVRDIWSPSRDELVAMTPADQKGPNYSDLARIVLQRARSAREGVDIIAALIAEHGYSTYGGNSHLIADEAEAWVVIECAGGRGLWAAERLGPADIRASRPGWIGEMAFGGDRFLHPRHLTDLAEEKGWWSPGRPFDFNRAYGDGKGRWEGVRWIEAEMRARAARPEKIGLADLFWAVRTERLTGDTAGYGQVAPLAGAAHSACRLLWHAHIGALAAPFSPVFMGAETVPEEFRMRRYLTSGESAKFEDRRFVDRGAPETVSAVPQGVESARAATATFKRLLYLILQRPERFLREATETWEGVESRLAPAAADDAKIASILIDQGEAELAARHLTRATRDGLMAALETAEALAASMEARTRAIYGVDDDPEPKSLDQIW